MAMSRLCISLLGISSAICGIAGYNSSRSGAGCGDDIVRGVNLGGWLLLEPWITPVFFEEVNLGALQDRIVDEWSYAELLDRDYYMQRMVPHWDEFVR